MTLMPRQVAPTLRFELTDGSAWSLGKETPPAFDMIVVYRGLHCPVCKTYLGELDSKLPEFAKRGVNVVAVSTDSQDRAEKAKVEWGLANLKLGFGLSIAEARAWQLYISSSIREAEPAQFSEPGLFLVKPDGTLFYSSRSSAPWGRPPLDQILRGIDIATERKMPARGEL